MVNYAPSELDECPACGYDLRDLPADKLFCPECGRIAPWHLPPDDREQLAVREHNRAHVSPWWYLASMLCSVVGGWLLLRIAPVGSIVLAGAAVVASYFVAYAFLAVKSAGWGWKYRSPWVIFFAIGWALVVATGLLGLLYWA